MFDGGTVTMEQLQILSHQFKIAQRIELFVGLGPDYDRAVFQRLGYAELVHISVILCSLSVASLIDCLPQLPPL